jgi:hypothetical protein
MIQEFRPEPPTDFQAILDIQNPELRQFAMLIAYRREKMQKQKAKKYDDYLADLRAPMRLAEEKRQRQLRKETKS